MLMIFYANADFDSLFSIKAAYYTPGLWDKEGLAFLFAFIFETPFALLRFIPPWLFLATCGMYVVVYYRYRKSIQQLL
ncbi:hypothetical protein [Lysinibacillus cavernae]|uniref:hypothetical protein n=1 Tax=Lysinibacillus cavernae TaxID=2666135 RepID=UPI001E28346E|nr:hypothetical protein [Lysinibacillus cavernae]